MLRLNNHKSRRDLEHPPRDCERGTHMTFSEKLQNLRKANGLSQEQLAEKLNVSRQAVSKWETGAMPDMDNMIKLCRFFDCSLDYLMKDEIERPDLNAQPAQTPPANLGRNRTSIILGAVMSGLGAIGILVLGILNSLFPGVIYDPPEGDVRAIMETGFFAFLKVHNLLWLFALCLGLILYGLLMIRLGRHGKTGK